MINNTYQENMSEILIKNVINYIIDGKKEITK